MKLCPLCEFIYEDDQTLCDMDGKELVHDQDTFGYEKAVAWSPQEIQYSYDRGPLAGEEIVEYGTREIHDAYDPVQLVSEETVVSSHGGIHDTYDPGPLAGEEIVEYGTQEIHDAYDPGPLAGEEIVVSSAVDIHDTYDPGLAASEETVVSSTPEIDDTLEIPLTIPADPPISQSRSSHFRRTAFASLAAVLLVALLFVVYYARTRQTRLSKASNQSSTQSQDLFLQVVKTAQQASDLVSAQTETEVSSLEDSSSESEDVTTSSSPSESSAAPLGRGRLIKPVSAGRSSASNRPPVVVWLANGSSIKADEAWEKKEGIWYRQGGMVTFLKRSRVRSIQQITPNQASKSVAIKAGEPSRKPEIVVAQNHAPENAIARNQSRVGSENNQGAQNRKPENTIAQNRPVSKPGSDSTEKDSKVTSFLKKTGRILKRPFQF